MDSPMKKFLEDALGDFREALVKQGIHPSHDRQNTRNAYNAANRFVAFLLEGPQALKKGKPQSLTLHETGVSPEVCGVGEQAMAKRNFVALMIGMLSLGLAGCEPTRVQQRLEAETRILKYQADILEMYRNCLKRKEADPKVDCSEYRTAIEIKPAK
ncbi:MAG: hypothetical protein ACE5JS_22810 [Nitrospinota bacterium]